jgi:chloride channel protein, CIC family
MSEDSIYTLKLRRRGIDIERPASSGVLAGLTIGEAMGPPVDPLGATVSPSEAAEAFLRQGRNALPVADESGAMIGVITVRDIERGAGGEAIVTIEHLVETAPELGSDDALAVAVDWLTSGDREGLPIFAPGGDEVVGWLDHRDVLRAYAAASARPGS